MYETLQAAAATRFAPTLAHPFAPIGETLQDAHLGPTLTSLRGLATDAHPDRAIGRMPGARPGKDNCAPSIPPRRDSSAHSPASPSTIRRPDDMTTLSSEAPAPDLAPLIGAIDRANWTAGCTVARRGPLTTLALAGSIDAPDIAGLDRAAALAIDLPGLEVLVIDVCDLDAVGPELAQWVLRVETWASRAGASTVVLAEHGRVLDWLRTPEASGLRVLRGSASVV